MTQAQMTEAYANKLAEQIAYRMNSFGDTYQKAKSMVSVTASCGAKCWAIVDAKFNA